MLQELHIRNFALVDEQSVSFGSGLNVISGETGAGKSVVLQAIDLILGGRARSEYIRNEAEGWEIQALFDLTVLPSAVREDLPDLVGDAEELVVSRTVTKAGRNKIFINGQLATLSLLESITSKLINVCRQGQQIKLLDSKFHLALIDEFAGNQIERLEYVLAFEDWEELTDELAEKEMQSERSALRRVELVEMIEELEPLGLEAGLRESLEAKVKAAGNQEKIVEISQQVRARLDSEGGAYDVCGQLIGDLHGLKEIDSESKELVELGESARTYLQELEGALSEYVSRVDIDQEELESLRERLAEIARLERKYRCTDGELVRLLEEARSELEIIEKPELLDELRSKAAKQRAVAEKAAGKLSKTRRAASDKLVRIVGDELAELNMSGARLEVQFRSTDLCSLGAETGEFLLSPNQGEGVGPLKQIASGGELSRIMLVLKKVLQDTTGVNVLVFDEIDAGISGKVARAVGEKLKSLSDQSQVVCVTHLAQVASLADHHFLVSKSSDGSRTTTSILELSESDRVDEVARMLSGFEVTDASRKSARELIGNY